MREQPYSQQVGFGLGAESRATGVYSEYMRIASDEGNNAQNSTAKSIFQGSLVALVTPMKTCGSIDTDAFCRLIDWHLEQGSHGLVIAGTTGEAATLDFVEHVDLVRRAVMRVAGRIPVIAGNGSASTAKAMELTKAVAEVGADACLCVTPYYNKPTQEGLYQHYAAIAQSHAIPQILYNVPGRTACDLLPATVGKLLAFPNIVAIKEASADIARARELSTLCGQRLTLLSGDDLSCVEFIKAGGKGVISVTANVAPRAMAELCNAARMGSWREAQAIQDRLMSLHQAMFVESNPIPVKWALHRMGLIDAGLRLPLTPLSHPYQSKVQSALEQAGCLS